MRLLKLFLMLKLCYVETKKMVQTGRRNVHAFPHLLCDSMNKRSWLPGVQATFFSVYHQMCVL